MRSSEHIPDERLRSSEFGGTVVQSPNECLERLSNVSVVEDQISATATESIVAVSDLKHSLLCSDCSLSWYWKTSSMATQWIPCTAQLDQGVRGELSWSSPDPCLLPTQGTTAYETRTSKVSWLSPGASIVSNLLKIKRTELSSGISSLRIGRLGLHETENLLWVVVVVLTVFGLQTVW